MALHLDGATHEFAHWPGHCRFHIRGVDELYGELEPRGVVKSDEQLATMPHGIRQFSILDPDGNRITFAASRLAARGAAHRTTKRLGSSAEALRVSDRSRAPLC